MGWWGLTIDPRGVGSWGSGVARVHQAAAAEALAGVGRRDPATGTRHGRQEKGTTPRSSAVTGVCRRYQVT
jgi:hypothetical protein